MIGWFDDLVDIVEDVADAPFDAVSHIVGKAAGTAGSIVKAGGKLGGTVLGAQTALAKQAAGSLSSTYRTLRGAAAPATGTALTGAAGAGLVPPASSNLPILLVGVVAIGAVLLLTRKKAPA